MTDNTPLEECLCYENADGAKSWFVDGKHHRLDGPAIETANGGKHWHLFGEEYLDVEVFEVAVSMFKLLFPENNGQINVK